MKALFIYILILISCTQAFAQDSRFKNANDLFTEGKFEEAIGKYQEILNSGVESASLYYNLGNAYYKTGNLPQTILNYERALLLSPHDKDIKYNLDLVSGQITDKIDKTGEFFLLSWFNSFKNSSDSDTWSLLSIISFVLCMIMAGLFIFSGNRTIKQLGFYIGVIAIVISIVTFNFARSQKYTLTHRNTAIIFSPSVTVKSSPSSEGNELFILHEGTKVKLLETLGDWNKVQIRDGNEGWVPSKSFVVI